MKQITTFLMFVGDKHGKAEEAINFYVGLFPHSRLDAIERYKAGEPGTEGTVKVASFTLNGQGFKAIDSGAPHQFTFTPAISLYFECDSLEELTHLYKALSTDGRELMPLADYGFSRQFGWVNDRFGVSWQLNLLA